MNWAQFKDPVSQMFLIGAVVACWSLTQEAGRSSPFPVMTNIFVTEFSETFRKKSIICRLQCSQKRDTHHDRNINEIKTYDLIFGNQSTATRSLLTRT